MKAFGNDYLRLALEINKHIEGYVDAYFGPEEIKIDVEKGEKKPIEELKDQLKDLKMTIPEEDPVRKRYLEANLRAMDCKLRKLGGEKFDFLDEVYLLFDIRPKTLDREVLLKNRAELEKLLPGSGGLRDRVDEWRKQFEIPEDKVSQVLELTAEEARKRTQALIELEEGEKFEIEIVKDKPWKAYNYFKGNSTSVMEINTSHTLYTIEIPDLIAHEGYPGHHTEFLTKEKRVYQEKGWGESAIFILHMPELVIAEGIATTALEMIFPDGSDLDWLAEDLLPEVGLPTFDVGETKKIRSLLPDKNVMISNVAIKYHTGVLTEEEALEYSQKLGLWSEVMAQNAFRYLSHPLFRGYTTTFYEGYHLIAQGTKNGDKSELFKKLLMENILPSEIGKN